MAGGGSPNAFESGNTFLQVDTHKERECVCVLGNTVTNQRSQLRELE